MRLQLSRYLNQVTNVTLAAMKLSELGDAEQLCMPAAKSASVCYATKHSKTLRQHTATHDA